MPRLLADLTPLRASPDFRRLWAALAVTNIGQQMTAVAVGYQVFRLTESSFAVGLVGLFQLVPLIGFGLYGGALSDSYDRRRVGIITAAGLMLCSLVLVAQSLANLGQVAVLYGVVAVQSAFFAVGNPARAAIVPRLVPNDMLSAANALGMFSFNLGFTIGPLLAGAAIAATGGETAVYAIDIVAFSTTLWAMWRLPPMPPHANAPQRAGLASVIEGLRFLRGRRNLQMSFYVDIAAMVFGMPRALFPALAVAFAATSTLQAPLILGLLSGAPAIGAVISSVLSGPVSRIHRQGLGVTIAVVVWGASIAAFGLSDVLWVGLIALAVAGAADNVSAILRTTILQAAAPDEFRGRLQGIFTVVVAGGPRLGDLESGTVAKFAGEPFSVVSGGLACIAVTAMLISWSPGFLRYDGRDPVP